MAVPRLLSNVTSLFSCTQQRHLPGLRCHATAAAYRLLSTSPSAAFADIEPASASASQAPAPEPSTNVSSGGTATRYAQGTEVYTSVAQVSVAVSPPNYWAPWQTQGQRESSGSAFVVEGNLLVTNAHVVAGSVYTQVRRHGAQRAYPSRLVAVAHELDLALLAVDDESFWGEDPCPALPLRFGSGLPLLQDCVSVLGYPEGGTNLCVTQGVVSRVGMTLYSHADMVLLAMQIDAAINAGNSGGPALSGDAVVGVAFQNLQGGENIGYVIPTSIVRMFLREALSPRGYQGLSSLGLRCQPCDNPAMRSALGMAAGDTGVVVSAVRPMGSCAQLLRPRDVLMSFDRTLIANDGSVPLRGGHGERCSFDHLVSLKVPGEEAVIEYLRDGVRCKATLVLRPYERLVPSQPPSGSCDAVRRSHGGGSFFSSRNVGVGDEDGGGGGGGDEADGDEGDGDVQRSSSSNETYESEHGSDGISDEAGCDDSYLAAAAPQYVVYGGLVFTPLSRHYLQEWDDGDDAVEGWASRCPSHLYQQLATGELKHPGQQLVVLSQVLADESTAGYSHLEHSLLKSVNGHPISSMLDLAAALAGAACVSGSSRVSAANRSGAGSSSSSSSDGSSSSSGSSGGSSSSRGSRKSDVGSSAASSSGGGGGRYVEFGLDGGRMAIVDAAVARAAQRRILERHRVPSPCSLDLARVLGGRTSSSSSSGNGGGGGGSSSPV